MKLLTKYLLLYFACCVPYAFALSFAIAIALRLRPKTIPYWNFLIFIYGLIAILIVTGGLALERYARHRAGYSK